MTTLKSGLAAPCYSALGCLLTVLSLPLLALDADALAPEPSAPEWDAATQKNLETLHQHYEVVQLQLGQPAASPQTKSSEAIALGGAGVTEALPLPQRIPQMDNSAQALSGASTNMAYSLAGRDPFAITPVMTESQQNASTQGVGFVPLPSNVRIPNMRLKGIITGSGQQPLTALLEIDGLGVFVVREGDTVGLQGVGNTGDVILVESISRLSLVVRTGSYGGVSDKRYVIR